MGRIVELCGEVAAEAEEGPEGLVLPPEAWERLRAEWQDQDIEDALALVHDSLMQSELVESADSLSARLLDLLGTFGETTAFRKAESGQAALSLEEIGQLARRVARLEEVLETYRDGVPPDRKGFDALRRRLADHGIEEEMERGRRADESRPNREDEEEEE
jgi:hypothetical protein